MFHHHTSTRHLLIFLALFWSELRVRIILRLARLLMRNTDIFRRSIIFLDPLIAKVYRNNRGLEQVIFGVELFFEQCIIMLAARDGFAHYQNPLAGIRNNSVLNGVLMFFATVKLFLGLLIFGPKVRTLSRIDDNMLIVFNQLLYFSRIVGSPLGENLEIFLGWLQKGQ